MTIVERVQLFFSAKRSANGKLEKRIERIDTQIDQIKDSIHADSKRTVGKLTLVQRQLRDLESLVVNR